MKNRYLSSFITSSMSIVPMIAVILLLSWILLLNPIPGVKSLNITEILMLLIGMVALISGLSLFQIGATRGLTKVGEYMGGSLSKQKNLFIIIIFAFSLGTLITCAEPSILIVSKQVEMNPIVMIAGIAIGVGVFVVIGVMRIIFQKSLKLWYLFFYAITFMLVVLISINPDKRAFLPFIFDSGGVTTGSATVPFILALGAGVAAVRGGKNAKNDSFGLVGMASIGPILTMTLLILFSGNKGSIGTYTSISEGDNIFLLFLQNLLPHNGNNGSIIDVLIALTPILIIFFIYELIFIKLPKSKVIQLLIGFFFSFLGLSLFLCATSAVMTPIGNTIGKSLGNLGLNSGKWIIVLISFILGLVTILCEPAVHVLTTQMADISDGQIKKSTVVLSLSIGVGIAIALSVLRSLYNFSIMYYIIPGYLIVVILMFLCPEIYVAMAFDSGGTASGPMSSSFILPMVGGIAIPFIGDDKGKLFEAAFGVVALIALTPIIAIEILGVIQHGKAIFASYINKRRIYAGDDAQIIHF